MRALTFRGFLKNYVHQLSGSNTESFAKLFRCLQDNPRLKAPLVLYAITSLTEQKLAKLATKENMLAQELNKHFAHVNSLDTLERCLKDADTPIEYKKVYNSFVVRSNRNKQEQELKSLIRSKALLLAKEKSVSDYRVYTDLGINNGNFHAFMHKGDIGKLGLEKAKQLLEYYEAC